MLNEKEVIIKKVQLYAGVLSCGGFQNADTSY